MLHLPLRYGKANCGVASEQCRYCYSKIIIPQKEDLDKQIDLLFKRGRENGAEVEIIKEDKISAEGSEIKFYKDKSLLLIKEGKIF